MFHQLQIDEAAGSLAARCQAEIRLQAVLKSRQANSPRDIAFRNDLSAH